METNEAIQPLTTRSVGIRYGVISGVISIAYFLVFTLSGISLVEGPARWGSVVFTIVLIILAHKYFKDKGDSYMSFGQGLGIGAWMGLVSGVISSIFTFFYVKFIDASFIENMKEVQIEKMQSQGMSEAQIEQGMKIAGMFMTPLAMLIMGIVGAVFGCFVISLIIGIFTQKRNPEGSTLD